MSPNAHEQPTSVELDSSGLSDGKLSVKDLAQGISDKKKDKRKSDEDRRRNPGKLPRGTVERRLEEDRRSKRKSIDNAKAQIEKHKAELKLQQHRKKILLAGCEPVMGLNYDSLAMDDYPENSIVAEARRDRDYWVAICACFSLLFVFSLLGLLDPWIGGVGAGLSFISAILAFSPARKFFFTRPHLHELLAKRKVIEYTALHHIQYLEGLDGLAWRCQKMAKFNPNLSNKLFNGLYRFSKDKALLSYMHNKKTIRLYLLLMTEAQKAYKRLEKEYLEAHFQHLDQGWDDRIDEAEALKIEQTLQESENEPTEELKS